MSIIQYKLTHWSMRDVKNIFKISFSKTNYRKISNIRLIKFQNLSDSRPVMQLSLPNLLKPCVKSRMKM